MNSLHLPSQSMYIHKTNRANCFVKKIRKNSKKMVGILNGIDTKSYDPSKDKAIFAFVQILNVKSFQ